MSTAFKLCTVCTPRYRKPVGLRRRKCPTCGAKGIGVFRAPTCEEIADRQKYVADMNAFIQQLASEAE